MQQRSNQQGGVIAYVIVGAVLLGLLAGSIYLAKHQARIARDGGEEQVQPIGREDEQQQAPSQSDEQTDGSNQQPDQSQDQTENNSDQTPADPRQESPQDDIARTGPSEIAATGPAETGAVLLASGVLVGTTVTYLRSARHLRRLP